jgi:hypothetical protein
MFDARAREEVARIVLPAPVTALAAVGDRVAAALEDGAVKICAAAAVERRLAGHGRPIAAMAAFGGDAMLLTAAADGELRVWNLATGEVLFAEQQLKGKFGEGALAMAVTPAAHAAQMFAVGGADGVVRVFGPK